MATQITAQAVAEALNEKFKDESQFTKKNFSVKAGKKFDKVVQTDGSVYGESIHLFVEKATGDVYKAAGYARHAPGVRYPGHDLEALVAVADVNGRYLYVR